MAISRIDKLLREVLSSDSLSESARARKLDLDVFVAEDDTGKLAQMALVTVALGLRCLSGKIRVHFCGDDPAGLRWSPRAFRELLTDEARTFGQPDRLRLDDSQVGRLRLGLGVAVSDGVFVDASGWDAAVNMLLPQSCDTQSPAAVFATCCGFAKVFSSHLLRRTDCENECWSFSVSSMGDENCPSPPASVKPFKLGKIGLLGAGAIGAGFAYCLWLSGWEAELDIIDRDMYDEPNQETTLFVGLAEAGRNRKKAVALAQLAERAGLVTRAFPTEITAGSPTLDEYRDVFVCAVDNPETRRMLDRVNSDLLVNAGVGGRAEDAGHVLWTRHLAGEPRLSTRYSGSFGETRPVLAPPKEIKDDCSRLAYEDVSLAAPFIGACAGAMLAASCGLHAVGHHPTTNYLKFDLLRRQSKFRCERFGPAPVVANR